MRWPLVSCRATKRQVTLDEAPAGASIGFCPVMSILRDASERGNDKCATLGITSIVLPVSPLHEKASVKSKERWLSPRWSV